MKLKDSYDDFKTKKNIWSPWLIHKYFNAIRFKGHVKWFHFSNTIEVLAYCAITFSLNSQIILLLYQIIISDFWAGRISQLMISYTNANEYYMYALLLACAF